MGRGQWGYVDDNPALVWIPGDPIAQCRACAEEISVKARFCNHCGTQQNRLRAMLAAVPVLGILGLVVAAASSPFIYDWLLSRDATYKGESLYHSASFALDYSDEVCGEGLLNVCLHYLDSVEQLNTQLGNYISSEQSRLTPADFESLVSRQQLLQSGINIRRQGARLQDQ